MNRAFIFHRFSMKRAKWKPSRNHGNLKPIDQNVPKPFQNLPKPFLKAFIFEIPSKIVKMNSYRFPNPRRRLVDSYHPNKILILIVF